MKKFVFVCALALPLIFNSCSKDDEKETPFSLSDDYVSLNVDETYQVSCTKEATWTSDNPFVATAGNSNYQPLTVVIGKHVGKTTITVVTREGEKGECEIEVLPVYTTYQEPVFKFGASRSTIKSKESRKLLQEKTTSLIYEGESRAIEGVIYMFENNKMTSAAVAVSFSKTEEVTKFLLERYQPIGEKDGIFLFVNNELKDTDMGIALTVQDDYLMIMYVPYEATFKSTDSSDKFARLKAIFAKELVK